MSTEPPPPPLTGYPLPRPTSTAQPAATFPYAGPPPAPTTHYFIDSNGNAYYYDHQSPQTFYAAQRIFLQRLLTAVTAAFLLLAAVFFIIWLVIRPRVPAFHLASLSVSHLNASGPDTSVSGNWTARLTVFNPNTKMHVYYDEVEGAVYYGEMLLAQNRLPPFDQGTGNLTTFAGSFLASEEYVGKSVVDGIEGERKRNGSVRFNVRLLAVVYFRAGGWRTRTRLVRVYCDGVGVGIPSNGSAGLSTEGSKGCAVGL